MDAKNSDDLMKPCSRHPRVDVADVLRGFAVMAIILLHSIEHFNFYSFPDTSWQPAWLNFADKAIWNGLFFAFGSKAYGIFALLFGFSFFIQDDNQRMRGNDFRLRFCWRLLCLFIIGQFDALFFTGEILVLYALVGFVLVLTCRLSTRRLVILGAIFILSLYVFIRWSEPGLIRHMRLSRLIPVLIGARHMRLRQAVVFLILSRLTYGKVSWRALPGLGNMAASFRLRGSLSSVCLSEEADGLKRSI